MNEVQITRRVPLDSKYLYRSKKVSSRGDEHGYRKHLLKKIVDLSKNECTLCYGYVIEVLGLDEDIVSSIVGDGTLENIFIVSYRAMVIKPVVGMHITGEVTDLDDEVIFVSAYNKFRIMISGDKLEDAGYVYSNKSYVRDIDTISTGSLLDIVITQVQYNCIKKRFTSIGALNEKMEEDIPSSEEEEDEGKSEKDSKTERVKKKEM